MPPNVSPVVGVDAVSVDEDGVVVIDVLANDTDTDGDVLAIVAVGDPTIGSASIDDDRIRYQPNPDANGTDSFAYAVSDGINPAVAGSVTVEVRPVNDAPVVAAPPMASIPEAAAVGDTVLAVDASDADGDPLTFTLSAGNPGAGLVADGPGFRTGRAVADPATLFAVDEEGVVTVAAPLDHETLATVTLDIDVTDGTTTTTVSSTVTVADVNDPPVAGDDGGVGFATVEDTMFTTGSVLVNDVDVDDPVDAGSLVVVSGPSNGVLVDNGDGTFVYDPVAEWSGTDSFSYTIADGGPLTSNVATVTIVVDPVNDTPQVTDPGDQTALVGSAYSFQIDATDAEAGTLTYVATGLPPGLSINSSGLIAGTPNAGSQGSYTVTITVGDSGTPPESTTVSFGLDVNVHELSPLAGAVVVNEVLYRAASLLAPEEFVELYNASPSPVELTGWTLADSNLRVDGDGDLTYTFPAADHWGVPSTLNPGEYAVIWLVDNPFTSPPLVQPDGLEFVVGVAGLKMQNDGDDVWLHDGDGKIVDYLAYGGGVAVGTPPEASLGLWDTTAQATLVTNTATSISLTPSGTAGDTSECWELTGSDDAAGRCPGAAPTGDFDNLGTVISSVGGHNNVTADAGGPYAIVEGDVLNLDASSSVGGTSYAWDLDGDGAFDDATGVNPSIPWSTLVAAGIGDDGSHPIAVEVDGGAATAATTVTITNVAPSLTLSGAGSARAGVPYRLSFGATDPGDDTISQWIINWGDGTIETVAGNRSSVNHTYSGVGFTRGITIAATDEDGTHFTSELLVTSYDGDQVFRYEPVTGAFLQSFAANNGPIEPLIGPDGRLYVSGEVSNNVLRFNAQTGAFIDEFVADGSGGLGEAEGMAFGPDGNLYIADWSSDDIRRYDGTTGAFIDVFVAAGLDGAYDVLFGPDHNLYVTSYNSDEVVRFDGTTGDFIDVFASGGGLDAPEQAVFGPDGNLYVASSGSGEVLRYNGTTGAFIDTFVATGGPGDLDEPTGMVFGPDGNLYVADLNDHTIARFDGTTGAYIDDYVPTGTGGLTQPALITFVPDLQVTITP